MAFATEAVPVRFSGTAREYFGIWIVNLLLSIVTLGIYSAWAKVRNKKYFLGNTAIDGRSFEYHARGLQILTGRAIVVAAIIVYSAASSIDPIVQIVVVALLAAILPWLINRGLRFNAAMTSWSNVRFRFEGNYWRAVQVFLLYPFLMVFSLYLAFPFLTRAVRGYIVRHHRLGGHRFAFDSGIGPFYAAFAIAILWAVLGFALSVGLLLSGGEWEEIVSAVQTRSNPDAVAHAILKVGTVALIVAILPMGAIYAAFTRNAIYAATALEGGHRFQSTIWPPRLVWIAISNTVAVVVSIGMLLPWTRIRMTRYLCAHSWVWPAGSLDAFVGEVERRQSAIGDAYMDIDGIDVGAAV